MGVNAGSLFLDLNLDTKKFNKQLNNTSSLAEQHFGKLGKTIAKGLSTAAIVSFGKSCIDLGSDLAEVQNVVDVTFPNMSSQVNEFAKNAINQFGLSETVAKRMTGTFGSMAKAFGFSESAAFNMSTALTGLAGDVASFYNLDPTEAYTKLKSVFSGETESLKDLGVVMTQNALDQFALAKGYGKTTSAMSEQEKVALRLAFVTDQLSAAGGDFSRTSDSWANKVRVLSLNFDSLKATLGQGFINVLSPIMSMLNTLVLKLQEAADWFMAFTSLLSQNKKTSTSMGSVSSAAKDVANNVGSIGETAKKTSKQLLSLASVDGLNIMKTKTDSDSKESSKSTGFGGADVSAGINKATSVNTSKAEKSVNKLKKTIDKFTKFFKTNGKVIISICAGIGVGFVAFETIKNWSMIIGSISTVKTTMIGLIETFKTFMRYPSLVTSSFTGLSMAGIGVVAGIAAVAAALIYLYQTSETFRNLVNTAVGNIGSILSNLWNSILKPLFSFLADVFNTIIVPIATFIATVFVKAVESIATVALSFWNNILAPLANFLVDILGIALKGVIGIWESWKPSINSLFESLSWLWNNILSPLATFVTSKFTSAFESWGDSLATIIPNIKGIFQGLIDFITGVFQGNWKKAWQGVKDIFSNIVAGFANIFKKPINAIIDGINSFIGGLNKIKIPSWVPGVGGKGLNISKIPKLAQGGYVKANTPQLAMIGDNKRYGEIVAPENKMIDMINTALKMQKERGDVEGLDTLISLIRELIDLVRNMTLQVDFDIKRLSILLENAKKEREMIGG